MPNVKIDLIRVERRIRKQLNNIESLAESIREVGLINPITIDSNYRLVAGERRLKAARHLGWNEIPSTIAANLTDALAAIKAERDENTQREPLTPGEIHEAARMLEEIERESARKRQAHGQTAPGKNASGKLPEALRKGDTRDRVAEAFDISGKTLDNIHKVFDQGSEELQKAVDSGEASISVAAEIAGAPKDDFRAELERKVKAGEVSIEAAAKEIKRHKAAKRVAERKQKAAEQAAKNHPLDGESYRLFVGDCEAVCKSEITESSVDCIITDPPYPAEFLDCFDKLSRLASRVLKPGGHCLVMSGQSHLPKVYELLSKHLDYQWTLSYFTPGQSTQVFGRKVKSNWKPVIWLTKGKNNWEHVEDWVSSDRNDKRFHHWGQSVGGLAQLVNRFTVEHQLILDPFCGGGSTGIAAIESNRSFVGIDIDPAPIQTTAERLNRREEAA